jgi:GT2 family glycosyltransferase
MVSMRATPSVSVVIPNYNGAAFLETCLASLARQTCSPLEILLVDNASQDDSLEITRRVIPSAVILGQKQNLGFAAAVNAGIRAARGEWIAVLNNDTEVSDGWLETAAAALDRHPEAAFVACRIMEFEDRNRLYSAGDCFLRTGIGYRRGQEQRDAPMYREEIEIFSAGGCAALYRKSVLDELQGFDGKLFAYLEDVDLGLRLQAAGYRGYYAPQSAVFHRGGGTSGGEISPLAVRLRTRNSILLLMQSLPARILWRCLPMILVGQASWLVRVAKWGRLGSYLRGLAGVVPLIPAAMKHRSRIRPAWKAAPGRLWKAILQSETLARKDFPRNGSEPRSTFLTWYFRWF